MSQELELLQKSNTRLADRHLSGLLNEPQRFVSMSVGSGDLTLDFSRTHLDAQALDELMALAQARGVAGQRDALFEGQPVNRTENRPALHMAVRSPDVLQAAGGEEASKVEAAMTAMLETAGAFHKGHLPGRPETKVKHLIHVGIGGSLLGPRLVCEALDTGAADIDIHFLGSVDAGPRERLLQKLDPAETVVIVVSKSFTTGDTLLHARRLRDWLVSHLGEEAAALRMFAVTSQVEKALEFGMSSERLLYFPEWVGGRFSVWSPVSLATAALIGPERFSEFLAGGAAMDRHFREAELSENLPVVWGLIGLWQRNYRGYPAWGVIPYDQRLRLLPAFLQQLIMESNGKSVTQEGQPVAMATAPLVFGETGTEAQHSLFQSFHQGTDIVPLNFVAVIRPDHDDREAQDELFANLLAQLAALANGRDEDATRAELGDMDSGLLAQRTFDGNRPSELLLLDELTPSSLGSLLALYEHKVFVESVLWEINAFDQWGVELGKTLAPGLQHALASGDARGTGMEDLLAHINARR